MIDSIFKILGAALSIWESKEKTKYLDRYMELKKDWYEEYNKPEKIRSDARLDFLESELRILGDSFAASVGKPDAKD